MDSIPVPKMSVYKTAANQSTDITKESSYSNSQTDVFADHPFQIQKGDILIQEVVVTEKKPDRYKEKRTMYQNPTHVLILRE